MRDIVLLALIAGLASPLFAAEQDLSYGAGVQATSGSLGYRALAGYFKVSGRPSRAEGRLSFRPAFSTYRSDLSSGSVPSLSARLGYEQDPWAPASPTPPTPSKSAAPS